MRALHGSQDGHRYGGANNSRIHGNARGFVNPLMNFSWPALLGTPSEEPSQRGDALNAEQCRLSLPINAVAKPSE